VAVATFGQQVGGLAPRVLPAMPAAAAGSELVVLPTTVGDKVQVLTVVDPRHQVLSVYHIELVTGKITLKSVRNIQWDLQMMHLNNDAPLPQEIRSLLEQR
jgi:nitrogen fixation protein